MGSQPRVTCDPHVVAVFRCNSSRTRIVAYNYGKQIADNPLKPPTWEGYELDVDIQEENAMGEVVWRACKHDDAHRARAKDHLLRLLLGLSPMDEDDFIDPPAQLGKHYRCLWAPNDNYNGWFDGDNPPRFSPGTPANPNAKPYPLAVTIWAPTEWAARRLFEAMHMAAMVALYAVEKPNPKPSDRMPTPKVEVARDPDSHPPLIR
jgi:hypothetical protein